jgi:hypothetical protein
VQPCPVETFRGIPRKVPGIEQRDFLGVDLEPMYAEAAKERQRLAGENRWLDTSQAKDPASDLNGIVDQEEHKREPRARDRAAEARRQADPEKHLRGNPLKCFASRRPGTRPPGNVKAHGRI